MLQPAINDFVLKPKKQFLPGNKCNHNSKLFREPNLPSFRRRPNVIVDAIAIAKKTIVSLTRNAFRERLLYFIGKGGKKRLRNSCRREAYYSIIDVFLNYTEMDTLRLSIARNPCDFKPISIKELLKKTGLSLSRLIRGLRDINAVGYFKTTLRWCFDERGDIKGEIAIRSISPQLFYDLGIKPKDLEAAREFKRGQQETEQVRRGTFRQVFNKALKSSIKKTVKKINTTIAQCRSGMQHVHNLATKSHIVAKPKNELLQLKAAKYPTLNDLQLYQLFREYYPENKYPDMIVAEFLRLPIPKGLSP